MSGVIAVRYLLANNSGLLAVVAANKIKDGALPLSTQLPAISVTTVSGNRFHSVANNDAKRLVTERVQVTCLAVSYAQQKQILRLVRAAVPPTRGTVNQIDVDSIIDDIEGPDMFMNNPDIYSQSLDFIVKYHA